MNFVIKSSQVPFGKRPIHKWPLNTLLIRFGVPRVKDPVHYQSFMFGKRIRRSLWDIWELVRSRWRELRKKLHPDKGGSHEAFAVMSAIHDSILKRLATKGIAP